MAADLKGRVALVTGVGPGLGQGIAVALARAGASVVVCDVNDEAIAATRKDAEGEGAECLALRCDMSDSQAVREMFGGIAKRYDLLNHVLSANIDPWGPQGSCLAMELSYGGSMFGPVLERLLQREIDAGRPRLLAWLTAEEDTDQRM